MELEGAESMRARFSFVLSLLAVLSAFPALAQISLTTAPSVQNFDGMANTAVASLPPNFRADKNVTARTLGTWAAAVTATELRAAANMSGTAANGIYNYGAGTSPDTTGTADRAVGFISSGAATKTGNLYAFLQNTSGAPLTGLKISYDVEKYRTGSNPNGFTYQLYYSTDGSAWTSAGASFTTSFAADGANAGFATAPGVTTSVTNQTLALPIPAAAPLYLAWSYSVTSTTTTTNAQGLGIDNISIAGIPGPPVVLSINRATPTPTNLASVEFTVTFDQSVTGVDSNDFALATAGVSGASITGVSGSGTTYTVTVNSGSGDGTIGLNLTDDDSIVNAGSLPLGGAGLGNGNFTGQVYAIDKTAPTVSSVNRTDGNPTALMTVHWAVTFSEAVNGFTAADLATVPGGGIAVVGGPNVSGIGPFGVAVTLGPGDGTIGLDVTNDGSITDPAGNVLVGTFTGEVYTVDRPPLVVSIDRANPSPTNAANVDFTVTFDQSVTGVGALDFALVPTSLSGTSITNVSGSGTTWTVTAATGSGEGTLGLNLVDDDSIVDGTSNPLAGPGAGSGNFTGQVYAVDTVAPSVQSIVRTSATNPTNAASVDFTVTFSETVTGVGTGSFTLNTTGVTGASITGVTGSGPYTVSVNTGSGDGTIRLDVTDDDTIADTAGNQLGGSGAGNGNFITGESYDIQKSSPAVVSIVRASSSPANTSSVNFTVTFSLSVTGVDGTDFAVDATGTFAGTGITDVTGSGTTYTVTAAWPPGGEGTVSIDLMDNESIVSTATSAPLGGPGSGNGDYTAGESYTIDVTAPSVSSSVRADPSPTNDATVAFTVTFSETVTGVNTGDFTLNTTGVSGASIANLAGSGTTYTVTVNTGTGDGTIHLDVADDDTIADAAGNTLSGTFTTGETYTVDKTAPTVQSSVPADANPTGAASVGFTVTFSEAITGTATGDYVLTTTGVTGTSVTNVTGSGTTYTVTANTGSGSGTIRLDVQTGGTIIDAAGNLLQTGFTGGQTYTIERVPTDPTGLNATAGDNSVALAWTASTNGALTYNVKRGPSSGSEVTIASSIAVTNYTDNTAVNGTTYFYVVSASNAQGESGNSNEVSATPTAPAVIPDVVISQVYGGGGASSGSPAYTHDYVELFNQGASTATLTGYSLQYGSSSGQFGSSAGNIYAFPAGTTIAPGKYLSIRLGSAGAPPAGAAVTTDLTSSNITMSATSGKIALATQTATLACGATATPCALPHAAIIDVVAYGASNNGEGGTSVNNGAALNNTQGALRNAAGCTDTNNNNADFTVATTASGLVPRTASTPATVCGASNNAPAINAPANPIATVNQDAAPFTVNLTGNDDGGAYAWSATPGTGVSSVNVTGGQGTNAVTYTVTLTAGFSGTATFTASLSDGVNAAATQPVNIQVNNPSGNNAPTINAPANPITTVNQDAAPFAVGLTGNDDLGAYTWSATPGTGVSSVTVTGGQGTSSVTYTVTLTAGFSGTATFTASLTDGVNPAVNQAVNITVNATGPPSAHVTISQVYGGGGNSGATYKNDYVELYNPTASTVTLTGWSLQYASSTSTTTWSGVQPLGGTIDPGKYYLIQLASGGAVGADLPVTPTISGDINMSATNGKVALVSNGDPLVSCNADSDIVDLVGYGTANCREGAANAPAASNTTALFRAGAGATDTNQNGSDFSTAAPSPRNDTPPTELGPAVTFTDPSNNASAAPRDANISITFTEPVTVSGAWFNISCVSTGLHNDATVHQVGAGDTWTIVPNVNFLAAEQCTVTIFKDFVHDADTDDAAAGSDTLSANHSWSFTVSTGTLPAYTPDVHLTFGNPSGAVADANVPNNYLMSKPELALSYNRSRGTPNWVSWHLADEWVGTLTRVDTFRGDPAIPPDWFRVLGSDYFASGFDRGHMVPNADRDKETSIPINQATFLMTNMLPQAPDNNQGPWANMENYLRTLLPSNELYIVAGGVGTGGTGSNGAATTIAGGNVTVPARTWKVVLILSKAAGDDVARVTASTQTLAVDMPNVQGIRTDNWMDYIVTVDAVEALTGYDFFANIPNNAIEESIEGGTNGTNVPGAGSFTVNATEDNSAPVTLQGASPSNGTITYTIVTPPANGGLTGSGANRTYTPNPNYFGSDSFTYKVNDGTGDSNTATVSITVSEVNDPPTAANDAKSTNHNTALTFPASDLAANDTRGPANEAAQTLTVTSVTATASTNGTVDLNAGNVTYTPNNGFSGAASFSYQVCDNGTTNGASAPLCASATVNVNVGTAPAQVTTHFSVVASTTTPAPGVPFQVTVTARDASNGVVTGYSGTVHFSTAASGATLPADYTFVAGDNGVHTFNVTMTTSGTITVTDVANNSITGSTAVAVTCPAPAAPGAVTMASRVCANAPGTASVSAVAGATTYDWTITNGTITGGQGTTTVSFTAGNSGTVTLGVTARSAANCTLATWSGSATIATAPTATVGLDEASVCAGTQVTIPVTLTGTAPFTIAWSDGVVQRNINTTRTSRTVTVLTSRAFRIVTISDANCTAPVNSITANVHVIAAPIITLQPRAAFSQKPGERINTFVVASGENMTYQWFEGEVGDESHQVGSTDQFTSLPLGRSTKFWVKVSNACGFVRSDAVVVTVVTRGRSVRPSMHP
jgi:DNA/RNA endonuclease G (NUC1)